MSQSIFDQFTRKYALSKTLRFELRPIGNTKQMLVDSGVIILDEQRKQRYEKTKPFFDRLHQEFISESLDGVSLQSLNGYDALYREWRADRKNRETQNKLEAKEKEIRSEIVNLFDKKADEWIKTFSDDAEFKKSSHEFLFEPAVFSILKKKYGDIPETIVEGTSIFESWNKWTAYFGKFFETRKNFYKNDGTATAVPTRIVNDNLRRFCDNIAIFEAIKSKVEFSTLQKDFDVMLDAVFALDRYNSYLNQAGIDAYNALLGGEIRTDGQKIKGINEYINEHRQKTSEKLPRLKKLDKQIGSDKEIFIDLIEADEQLHEQLIDFVANAKEKVNLFSKSVLYLTSETEINLAGIYFRKEALNTITRRWFANYEKISALLVEAFNDKKSAKFDPKTEEYKFPDFISWQVIKDALEKHANAGEEIWKEHYVEELHLKDKNPWQQFLTVFAFEYENLKVNGHEKEGDNFSDLVTNTESLLASGTVDRTEKATEIIKSFSDRVLNIYRFAKYFALEKSRQWNPDGLETEDFYTDYEQFYNDSYEKIVKVYDKIRNYITKKPFNQDKRKLNFENPTLATGWDKNKEADNTAVLLRKDGRYFLAIMDKNHRTLFKKIPSASSGYEKMTYKLFPDPSKMMPKVCFSQTGLNFFHPSEEILRIYNNGEFKKGETFSLASMHALINFYKISLKSYPGWAMYNFSHLKETGSYTENISEFYNDVAEDGYQISFGFVPEQYIEGANNDGKLYLFEIHNKDWNLKDGAKKTGVKNVHTLYFEQAFSEENAQNNFVVKLNGEAELFFRPATSEEKLGTRQDKSGKTVTKNRRYAQDKMFFHVPVTLNRTAPDARRFNQSINELLANNPDVKIIGLDRGEKHLAYLSVINQQGEILAIESLNTINNIPYAELLEERAKNRENARRDWKNIEQIKDLKKGYVSNVVRKIADLIIKYNAIVVFEDLNMRFKQVRGGIEKSVYQQLEKALIDKLNFLVDKKEVNPEKAGHILRAYQLTAPFETFKDMGKQTGVLFYTQAEYTSQTDPVTGFRKNVYISNSATVEKIKEFISKLGGIGWDEKRQSYFFTYNPINFVDGRFKESTYSKEWTVYVDVPRIKREHKNGYWEAVTVNPNNEFEELFRLWDFDNPHTEDIKKQILQKRFDGTKEFDGKNRNFWHSFIFLFNLVLQVRNSTATQYKRDEDGNVIETIEGVDFIASPVAPFFTTDGGKYTESRVNLAALEDKFIGSDSEKERFKKEYNGDANGAYNIARKGAIILRKIADPENLGLFITKKEWDEFAANK